jgi:ketosteroid isomerase-like protein
MMSLRNTKPIVMLLPLILVVLGPPMAPAQQAEPSKETAIRQAGAAYIQALQRRDASVAAACWTATGMYTDATGLSTKARDVIQQKLVPKAGDAASSDAKVEVDSKIRFVTATVAIEEGTHRSDNAVGRFTATWVQSGGRWLLDHLVEHATVPAPSAGRLQELSWMIGDWFGQGDGFSIMWTANWSENRKFIVRRFFVEKDGKQMLNGEQRIGWHPGLKAIRSWGFDSNGGIVEGRWRHEGDAWIVRNSGVAGDGSPSSSISFWLREGDDRCALKTSHALVGDDKIGEAVVEFSRLESGS